MTRAEWYKQQAEDARSRFPDHIATTPGLDHPHLAPEVIRWAKPGTGTYSCTYIIHHRWLCVMGDIGEAIFEWSEKISPAFLAYCDWHYLLGKCQASPSGRKYESWDSEFADAWAKAKLSEASGEDVPGWLECISDCGGDQFQFETAARDVYDETGDAEEAGEISQAGMVPDFQFVLQYEGLQLALKQLGYGANK